MPQVPTPGTADDVGTLLHDHLDVVVPIANGEPVEVVDAIERIVAERGLEDVQVHQMHVLHDRPYLHGEVPGLRHVSYFLSHVTRPLVARGQVDVVPAHFSEVPDLLEERRAAGRAQLLVAAVAGPDEDDTFSMGLSSDYAATLLSTDVPVFVEANARMPFTRGDNTVHASRVAGWCASDYPLVEVPPVVPSEIDRTIAGHVVERIPDGATLQAGIGGVPDAVLRFLTDHRDLGVHTELVTDGFMHLIRSGR